jgi:hypothetical protein
MKWHCTRAGFVALLIVLSLQVLGARGVHLSRRPQERFLKALTTTVAQRARAVLQVVPARHAADGETGRTDRTGGGAAVFESGRVLAFVAGHPESHALNAG